MQYISLQQRIQKLLQTSSQFYDAETQSLLGFATLIDASSRIYARVNEVGKEEGRSLVFANGLRVSCKKEGLVYDLIAKI